MAVDGRARRVPQRPDEARVDQLNRLADLHLEWTRANAEGAGFDPTGRRRDGDYPLHHVDLDAAAEALDDFHRRAAEIFADGGTSPELQEVRRA